MNEWMSSSSCNSSSIVVIIIIIIIMEKLIYCHFSQFPKFLL